MDRITSPGVKRRHVVDATAIAAGSEVDRHLIGIAQPKRVTDTLTHAFGLSTGESDLPSIGYYQYLIIGQHEQYTI